MVKAHTATGLENTQLNHDRMRLSKLKNQREAVAAFIDTVLSRSNPHNDRLHEDLNALVLMYKTDLATTIDIRPTVAAVCQAQEATRVHVNALPFLVCSCRPHVSTRFDQVPYNRSKVARVVPVRVAHPPHAPKAVCPCVVLRLAISVSVCCSSARVRVG